MADSWEVMQKTAQEGNLHQVSQASPVSAWEELLFLVLKGIPSQENQRSSEEGPYLACLLRSVTFTLPSTRLRYNLGREQSVRTRTCLWSCPLLCYQWGQG